MTEGGGRRCPASKKQEVPLLLVRRPANVPAQQTRPLRCDWLLVTLSYRTQVSRLWPLPSPRKCERGAGLTAAWSARTVRRWSRERVPVSSAGRARPVAAPPPDGQTDNHIRPITSQNTQTEPGCARFPLPPAPAEPVCV